MGGLTTTTGNLMAVPSLREAYYDELDTAKWGLAPVAKIDDYKGMIFATFNPDTPPLAGLLGRDDLVHGQLLRPA